MATVSADLEDGHVIPEHSHPEDQLLFASEGVMTLSTTQGVWVVPPMRAVWIPAETFHSVATSGRVSMRTLYLQPKLGRALPQKCFVMNVTSLLRELVLHACRIGRLHRRAAAERRLIEMIIEHLKAVESVPLQLPRPVPASAESGGKISRQPGRTQKAGKIVPGVRRKQKNHSTTLPRRNKNDFQPMAPTASPPSCHATPRFGRESHRRGPRCGIQQHQRVHRHVPQTTWQNTSAISGKPGRIKTLPQLLGSASTNCDPRVGADINVSTTE